ncbi:LamB/YcsF family protein [Trinickia symbiotica]|uniref:5-oxoprolinase subunit A n=1 Tax=Trinickia symbiotica TaxID=863227 RepID=A0A2T3XKP7_9BURK|nr:5-oxoprolinase subunit PxpA [Trinickia symbiotica]PTB16999.1 LamB/YcsF family protein [Trinickia symbiotica]
MPEKTIDLNVDLGEGFGNDSELLDYATSANVACGWHAGDPLTMRRVTTEAIHKGVAIGAHPSYPDRENFGRRAMDLSPDEVYADVQYQVGALAAVVAGLGGSVTHVKPHGALYNQAEEDTALACAIVHAVRDMNHKLAIVGLAGGQLVRIARDEGLDAIEEAFADRAYTPEGKLVPRSQPNALLESEAVACEQAISMVRDGRVRAVDGSWVSIRPQTLCLHGDGLHAVSFASQIRAELAKAKVAVRPLKHAGLVSSGAK